MATSSSLDLDFDAADGLCQQFYITPRQLLEAKQLFDHYISLEAGASHSSTGGTSVHGEISAPLHKPRMSVKALEMVFKDLGVIKTNIEVRDLIEELTGHIALLDKRRIDPNEEPKAEAPTEDPKKKAKAPRPSSSNKSPKRKRLGGAEEDKEKMTEEEADGAHVEDTERAESKAPHYVAPQPPPMDGILFEQFLSLLLTSFEEEEEMSVRKEIEASFRRMDVDGNGELSEQDIRQAIDHYQREVQGARSQTYNVDKTDVMQLVANMHSAEMQLALSECDLNGDGVVTMSDFALCLLRS